MNQIVNSAGTWVFIGAAGYMIFLILADGVIRWIMRRGR